MSRAALAKQLGMTAGDGEELARMALARIVELEALADDLTMCCDWNGDEPDQSKWHLNRFLATAKRARALLQKSTSQR